MSVCVNKKNVDKLTRGLYDETICSSNQTFPECNIWLRVIMHSRVSDAECNSCTNDENRSIIRVNIYMFLSSWISIDSCIQSSFYKFNVINNASYFSPRPTGATDKNQPFSRPLNQRYSRGATCENPATMLSIKCLKYKIYEQYYLITSSFNSSC